MMAEQSANPGFFKRLRQTLNRGTDWLSFDFARLAPNRGRIEEAVLEELETQLLLADVGVDASREIVDTLAADAKRGKLTDANNVRASLVDSLTKLLAPVEAPLEPDPARAPFVILVAGINGTGKTTTVGKLAWRFKNQGLRVMTAAADTFRAAAIDQLVAWGERADVPVIAQKPGADPAAVAFDALTAAKARSIDVLLIDTAGRLHTQAGLMDELKKIHRVIGKADASAPHEVLLVLDAGTGQNALAQAAQFNDAVNVTGLAITKLDGTAKGGVLLAIAKRFGIPIRYVGVGERAQDLDVFNARDFATAMLAIDDSRAA
ncbi:MAG TPA: signal recognition particle-docking protein FtsY [Gammaproteobacteria bacterium]|jgi:fused signal recognition particle receptor|nr:signal recognition particle-docking protein FtsY [Gammaproteobacteria bacterium]